MIQYKDNVFDMKYCETIYNYFLENAQWKFRGTITPFPNYGNGEQYRKKADRPKSFRAYKDIYNRDLTKDSVVNKILNTAKDIFNLRQVENYLSFYLTGTPYNIQSGYHADSDIGSGDRVTLLYYINTDDYACTGTDFKIPYYQNKVETLYDNRIETVDFVAGRFVLFDSTLQHRAGTSRDNQTLRMSLVWNGIEK
jgi:hypothetical protein